MKLNIVNPEAKDLGSVIGLSEERKQQLSEHMDRWPELAAQQDEVISSDMWQAIIAPCQTVEEVLFCAIVHTEWLCSNAVQFIR